ncbi:MAG: protein-glutamate O-methyltransferase CheR [Archaeoglobaceae archaeon]
MDISDLALRAIVDYVSRRGGADLSGYRESYLKRRIEYRMKSAGVDSVENYLKLLRTSDEEIKNLLDAITINVTEFMRDKTPFESFRKNVLKEIVERKKGSGSNIIRIWSAGCSYGEEPYSIAICVMEELNEDWRVTIYATDVDENCLNFAKNGVYEEKSILNLDPKIVEKYFEKINGKFKVKPILQKCVKFRKHDLIKDPPISRHFDVIFCRNVIIYFNDKQKDKVFADFYDSLSIEGYLIIGKSETIPEKFKSHFDCINLRDKIYKKVSGR